jgi:hypothetical protein
MTVRIWGRVMLTAVGVAALVGAGQLGVAYGLDIVRLSRSFEADAGNQWNAQLAWVSWFAMLAAVAGAAAAVRAARRSQYAPGLGTRILVALFGGAGAGVVVPLSVGPARAAELTQSVDPALVVGLAAGLGAAAGVLVAVATLSVRPLAWHLATVTTAVWLAGLATAGHYLGPDDTRPWVRLGVPEWTARAGETDRLVEMLGMPALALLAGLVVAAVARGRRQPGLGVAVSGLAGATPLALAYLIAGPGSNGDTADQMAPYLGTLIAVPAGLLGSLLVTLVRRGPRAAAADGTGSRSPDVVEPTNIIPPLATKSGRGRRPAAEPAQWSAPRVPPPAPPARVRASASASVPRPDEYVDWVGGLGKAPGDGQRPPLPRRVPGERFPAGA